MTGNSHAVFPRLQGSGITPAIAIAGAVFLACLLGIYTRPVNFLATVWPANAVMLGLLLRFPQTAKPLGWFTSGVAFLAADLLTGSTPVKALILNGANLVGIAAAYGVYMRCPATMRGLRQPASMLYLLLASAAGGAAAGIVGGFANPVLFGGGIIHGWTFWFATEFVNYATILPLILSTPGCLGWWRRLREPQSVRKSDFLPAAVLLLTFLATISIGGPGAIAFPVPALLWCALVYPVFPTALLTLFFGVWTLVVISAGYGPAHAHDAMDLVSIRLGISLTAVAPVMLACVMESRNELLSRLHHLALHDPLTGSFNRQAFLEEAQRRLDKRASPSAIFMIDLDHFKAINDTYGHAAGDAVLIAFAQRARACLRPHDVFGRLGGEEFAAMIADCREEAATTIADRIRAATREPIILESGETLVVTASIGIVTADPPGGPVRIDDALSGADAMLYRAKHNGRNRTEISVMKSTMEPVI